jgi:hypothetical protein
MTATTENTTATRTETLTEEIRSDLAGIEMGVLTNVHLSDLIRAGAARTEQSTGWGNAEEGTACALAGAGLAAEALGYIETEGK